MRTWKGSGNTTTLLFAPKGLDILHQEMRTSVHHSDETILLHKSGRANEQHTYQSSNQSVNKSVSQSINQSSINQSKLTFEPNDPCSSIAG
jgi:hypothetical protein